MKREWQFLPVSEGILDLVCSAVEMACCGGPSTGCCIKGTTS